MGMRRTADDLISRQGLLDSINRLMKSPWFLDGYVGIKDIEGKRPEEIINRLKWEEKKNTIIILRDFCVRNMPAVEAVPLGPLCKLLHEIAYVPCYTVPGLHKCGEVCGECDTTLREESCWMQFLQKWMEGQHDNR